MPLYVIVDSAEVGGRRKVSLKAFRWTPEGFEALPPGDQGRFWLDPVRVWLGTAAAEYGDRVACFDQEGREIGDYEEINRARIEAEAKFAQAEAKATEAEAKAVEAEGKAAEAVARAAQETAARTELERHLHALEEELRRVKGSTGQQ